MYVVASLQWGLGCYCNKIFKDRLALTLSTSWKTEVKNLAVYDPNQVKSATGNAGSFSRDSKDIRLSKKADETPQVQTGRRRPESQTHIYANKQLRLIGTK
jgi:hypothetical protein